MARHRRAAAAAAAALALLASGARAGPLAALPSEAAVRAQLTGEAAVPTAAVDAGDVELFVRSGWYDAVRDIVQRSHEGSEDDARRVATMVRQAVQAEKNSLDDLIRALDRNYGRASEVSPAVQWAQNSTHVFLSVKFAQRWNAPGALEVENETVSITSCCFNFTAFGEHSMIRRRYHLSWEFFKPMLPDSSSWSRASAGRMTVFLAKAKAASWPRLLSSTAPKNLGIWRDMKEKWAADLERLVPDKAPTATTAKAKPKGKGTTKSKTAKAADEADDDEALDKEVDLISDCPASSYAGTPVAELCEQAWPKVVEVPRVRGRRWLVQLYSSRGDGDQEDTKRLIPVWRRLADTFPAMVPGGRVASLDCGVDRDFCRRIGAASADLPQVRRFLGGTGHGDAWTGPLDPSIEDFTTFGGAGSHDAEL